MRTTQINRKIMDNIYGNQCGSDNAFTRKARLLQSMYRVEIGEEEGFGPTRASKRKYGNMISGGEVSGKNFLMKETFEYAKVRVANKRENETIDGFRLFNKLLSLFHPPVWGPADGIQPVPSPDVTVEAGSGNGYACCEVGLQELPGI